MFLCLVWSLMLLVIVLDKHHAIPWPRLWYWPTDLTQNKYLKHQVVILPCWLNWEGGWGFGIWCSLLPCLKKRSLLIWLHVISVQTCRWNAKYPRSWEFLGIDSHWSLLFWCLTCDVKIDWLIFPILQMLPVYIFINYVSRGLLQRDNEVMCVPCAKERCQSPGH